MAIVSRIYRRKQFHRARVTALLREFRRLTTAMPEGAVLLGPEHEILWFNQRAAQWLGLRRKRDFGIRIENLVRQPGLRRIPAHRHARRRRHRAGRRRPARWFSFHVVRTGMAERQLLMVRDVSREQQLQSMRKDFVANASHELRSPLTVITGYLDALADDQKLDRDLERADPRDAPAGRAHEHDHQRSAGAVEAGVRRAAARRGARRRTAGMLALLRKETLAIEQRPREVRLTLDSDAWLKGVENELHSIVSNLLSNAVKYTPAHGEVELRWWTDDEGGHICGARHGSRHRAGAYSAPHGAFLSRRLRALARPRRLGAGTRDRRHALQRHDATLTIESVEGRGSKFTCHFPAQRVVPQPADFVQATSSG